MQSSYPTGEYIFKVLGNSLTPSEFVQKLFGGKPLKHRSKTKKNYHISFIPTEMWGEGTWAIRGQAAADTQYFTPEQKKFYESYRQVKNIDFVGQTSVTYGNDTLHPPHFTDEGELRLGLTFFVGQMPVEDRPIVRAIIGNNPYVCTNIRPMHFDSKHEAENKLRELNGQSHGHSFFNSLNALNQAKSTKQYTLGSHKGEWDKHPHYNELLVNLKSEINEHIAVTIFKPKTGLQSLLNLDEAMKQKKFEALEIALELCEVGADKVLHFPNIIVKRTESERVKDKGDTFSVLKLHELLYEIKSNSEPYKFKKLITRLAKQHKHLGKDDLTLKFLNENLDKIQDSLSVLELLKIELLSGSEASEPGTKENIYIEIIKSIKNNLSVVMQEEFSKNNERKKVFLQGLVKIYSENKGNIDETLTKSLELTKSKLKVAKCYRKLYTLLVDFQKLQKEEKLKLNKEKEERAESPFPVSGQQDVVGGDFEEVAIIRPMVMGGRLLKEITVIEDHFVPSVTSAAS